jgi:hypothetical protein
MKNSILNSKKILLKATIFVLLFLTSCGEDINTAVAERQKVIDEQKKTLDSLRNNAEKVVNEDLKNVTKDAIDKVSYGMGSIIFDLTMESNEQDSLFIGPMIPFINKELTKKNEKELKEIINKKTYRFKFIGSTLLNNKSVIVSAVSSKYKYAEDLVNAAIQIYNSAAVAKDSEESEKHPGKE